MDGYRSSLAKPLSDSDKMSMRPTAARTGYTSERVFTYNAISEDQVNQGGVELAKDLLLTIATYMYCIVYTPFATPHAVCCERISQDGICKLFMMHQ